MSRATKAFKAAQAATDAAAAAITATSRSTTTSARKTKAATAPDASAAAQPPLKQPKREYTKWTRTEIDMLLNNLLSYINQFGMPHSPSKKPKKANDDEEDEAVSVTPVKLTAGDQSWTIISQGTNHTPNQAYDKWCNIKDKEQPKAVDDVLKKIRSSFPTAAGEVVTRLHPGLRGAARDTEITKLCDKWNVIVTKTGTKPSHITVAADESSEPIEAELEALLDTSNVTTVTCDYTLKELTDKIDEIINAATQIPTGQQETEEEQQEQPSTPSSTSTSTSSSTTLAASATAAGKEKKKQTAAAKKAAEEALYRQSMLAQAQTTAANIAKLAQASASKLSEVYPTPTHLFQAFNIPATAQQVFADLSQTIDVIEVPRDTWLAAGVSEPKAAAMLALVSKFIEQGRV